MDSEAKFHRILLKISGEALMGDEPYGIDSETVNRVAFESPRFTVWACRFASSSAAAISFAEYPAPPPEWNAPAPIMSACWRPS